jgi:Ran GTPase-activating protein (RanGAP) involved in mRNA processing and transport
MGIRALAEALQTNSTLQVLVLRNVDMIDEGATALAQALKSNLSALQTLDLRSDGIWDRMVKVKGGEALAEALKTNATLQTLDLGGNRILCEGAIALAKALKVNSSLHTLGLDGNKIGSMGAMALAEALEVNSALQALDLGSNEIGTGVIALTEALKTNTTLQRLDITYNGISSLVCDQIKRLFSHDETLEKRFRLLQDSPYDDQIYVTRLRPV